MGVDDPLGNVQPEAQILARRDRFVAFDTVHRIEYFVQLVRRDDRAAVVNCHCDSFGSAADDDVDGRVRQHSR